MPLQDDLFVDIGYHQQNDSIFIALEAASYMLDDAQANEVSQMWATHVRDILE
jgi:hypothetical protein